MALRCRRTQWDMPNTRRQRVASDAEQPTLPDAGLHLIHPDLADEARKAAVANMLGVDESVDEEDQQAR